MNPSTIITVMRRSVPVLFVAISWSTLSAQPLDPVVLQNVKDTLSHVRHPDQVDMLALVRSAAPTNPEAYLMVIADDSSQMAATRMKAIGVLGSFAASASVQAFLENRLGDPAVNITFRQMAITSYVRAFYEGNPTRVQNKLRSLQNDHDPGVRDHARAILSRAQDGQRYPAGQTESARRHSR